MFGHGVLSGNGDMDHIDNIVMDRIFLDYYQVFLILRSHYRDCQNVQRKQAERSQF